jgi:hypothetical protein
MQIGVSSPMQPVRYPRIRLKLRRANTAQFWESSGRIEAIFVGSLVVDDPPRVFVHGIWRKSRAEDAIHLYRAQTSVDDSCPADLVLGLGVRRKNPLCLRVGGGLERNVERLRSYADGLLWIDTNSANFLRDAWRQLSQRCECGI